MKCAVCQSETNPGAIYIVRYGSENGIFIIQKVSGIPAICWL